MSDASSLRPEGRPAPTRRPGRPDLAPPSSAEAFGRPRNSLDNRFVYAVISQRARGLSLGVNLNPDQRCNFDCVYCEVVRTPRSREARVDVAAMSGELERLLDQAHNGGLRQLAWFRNLPDELLQLKEVALSGSGEPTLCPNFAEVVHTVLALRSAGRFPWFKLVLITNATGLDLPEVQLGIDALGPEDEVWAKLDAGTQAYMNRVNQSVFPLWRVLANILTLSRRRPVVIQSLFPMLGRQVPAPEEIEQYVERLRELTAAGARIAKVQVYSAHRPPHRPDCEHLPLKALSSIARRVREATGLKAEVF